MYKKLSFIFIFILILMCLFCIKSYASTDYSVYNESSGQYHIVIPDKLKEELGLPSIDVPYYFSDQNLYYFIFRTSTGRHVFLASTVKFEEVNSDDSSFAGTYSIKNSNNARPTYFYINKDGTEWTNGNYYSNNYYETSDLSTIIFSSDDIYNNVTGNLIFSKTVYTEDSGDTGDTGDGGNSGSTEGGGNTEEGGSTEEIQPQYYSFNGFDGVEYKFSPLPDGLYNYKHFIIVKEDYTRKIYLFCFNDSLSITYDSGFVTFNGDNNTTLKLFLYNDGYWEEMGEQGAYSMLTQYNVFVINSCIDLLKYSNDFNSGENFFYQPPQIVTSGILSPVVHKLEMKGVLKEIIMILPIVIVVLVGFLGLRKALKTLFQGLRHS